MNRPHVTLKLATSLDGRIAMASGESRWITGEAARAEVHRMRAASDAVMIGAGTARADDPSLLARTDPLPLKQPMRVVLATTFDIPTSGRLFESFDVSPLMVIGASPDRIAARSGLARVAEAGARWGHVIAEDNQIDIELALHLLSVEKIERILVEGGGKLAASLIAANLVDRLEWFRAPIVLGDAGRPAVAALEFARLADAPRWKRVAVRELGPDLWESYERAE